MALLGYPITSDDVNFKLLHHYILLDTEIRMTIHITVCARSLSIVDLIVLRQKSSCRYLS